MMPNGNDHQLLVERRGPAGRVGVITLNRREAANAYSASMLAGLEQALTAWRREHAVRAVVITGAGDRSFCAGADLNEVDGRGWQQGLDLQARETFDVLADAPFPTVAAINGAAVGGGLELALACDIRVATKSAVFAFPEASLGLLPAAGGTWRLPDVIGYARAREMLLFGRRVTADVAHAWGLVAYSGEDFLEAAMRLAERAADVDPLALRLAKLSLARQQAFRELPLVAESLLYERRLGGTRSEE